MKGLQHIRVAMVAATVVTSTVACSSPASSEAPTSAASSGKPIALPSKDAASAEVLDAYLRALKAGDCKTAQALTTSSFASNGELCGHVRVKSYTPVGSPATPGDEAIFSTNLITQGGNPSLMPDGLHTRFYSLIRQADGAWRVASGGSGP